MASFQRENRPIVGVGVGKGKTMHETDGVEFATAHLATDVTLHDAERGDREGEAIIFLHGYSDSWYSFGRVLPLLSPEYHAFALSQRGLGDSDKPECCYTVDDYAADVDASWTRLASSERPSSVLRREPFSRNGRC
jgi:alpha-beta hydrolase superfamily lysophospholipase